jgi:secondary thiamine-phosphate synthase enzyme
MHTLSPAFVCHLVTFRVASPGGTAFVDLTERLDRIVAEAGIRVGLLNVSSAHTTTGIVVNEDEPLLLADFEACLERLVPRRATYAHDDLARRIGVGSDEPRNGHAHCRALLLPSSAGLAVANGRLLLGRWQRVFLVELDGPRERELSIVLLGEPGL